MSAATIKGRQRLEVLTGVALDSDLNWLDERVVEVATDIASLALGVDGVRVRHGAEHLVLEDAVSSAMEMA